jgi:hypothetical protein
VGSLEEVIGKMQADASGEWASVMFIPAGAPTAWAGHPLSNSLRHRARYRVRVNLPPAQNAGRPWQWDLPQPLVQTEGASSWATYRVRCRESSCSVLTAREDGAGALAAPP